jgi:tetratricopeptide (TPR) repeat protein
MRIGLVVASLALMLLPLGCGEGKGEIEISYTRPAQYDIPESVRRIAIAEFGGKSTDDKRWGDIASDKLASTLDEYNKEFDRYQLVDRKRLKGLMDERDLQMAIADTSSAVKIGKLAKVEAMIYGNVHVDSRDERAERQVIDPIGQTTKTITYTKRYCIAAVNFTMDDINTGKTLATVTVTKEYDSEKKPSSGGGAVMKKAFGFGDTAPQATEDILNGLIGQCVEEFVAKISPHRVSFKDKLEGGKSELTKTGNTLAASGEYKEALENYLQALESRPDDAGTLYDAALMYEALGKLKDAEKFYTRAIHVKAKESYVKARKRVRQEMAAGGNGGEGSSATATTQESETVLTPDEPSSEGAGKKKHKDGGE